MKPLFIVTAPVATRSGYGAHSRDIVRALIDIGKWEVKVQPVRWGSTPQNALRMNNPNDLKIINSIIKDGSEITRQPDIHLHLVVPNEFNPFAKFNIGMTAGLETTLIPQDWIEGYNRMDLNLLSSVHGKDSTIQTVMKNAQTGQELKVVKPIDVVFEGADTDVYKVTKQIDAKLKSTFNQIKENWNFLFVGHWLQGNLGEDRKDVGTLVSNFLQAFKGKKGTGLIMKTSGATPSEIDKHELMRKINIIKEGSGIAEKDMPNIYILSGDFTDEEMNMIYNHPKVKAHITYTHGEGFGRPLLEASLSEKPIIAPNWSGHIDFLNPKQTILLPGKLDAVPQGGLQEGIWQNGMGWFYVDQSAGISAMVEMRNNYKTYKHRAKIQAMANRGKFSYNAMVKKLDSVLSEHLPEFTETVQPQLPQMDKPGELKLPKLEKVS